MAPAVRGRKWDARQGRLARVARRCMATASQEAVQTHSQFCWTASDVSRHAVQRHCTEEQPMRERKEREFSYLFFSFSPNCPKYAPQEVDPLLFQVASSDLFGTKLHSTFQEVWHFTQVWKYQEKPETQSLARTKVAS